MSGSGHPLDPERGYLISNQVITFYKICNGHTRTIASESVSDGQSNSRRRSHFAQIITLVKGKPGAAKIKGPKFNNIEQIGVRRVTWAERAF
jgi:hypothetical protein